MSFTRIRVHDVPLSVIWDPLLEWTLEPEQSDQGGCVLRVLYPRTSVFADALIFRPFDAMHVTVDRYPSVTMVLEGRTAPIDARQALIPTNSVFELPWQPTISIWTHTLATLLLAGDRGLNPLVLRGYAKRDKDMEMAFQVWDGKRQARALPMVPEALYLALVGLTGSTRNPEL